VCQAKKTQFQLIRGLCLAEASLRVVRTVKDLRKATAKLRSAGDTIALVPTMGALHAGHLALVKLAHKKAARVVVSIFVNPTQFAPTEDLSRYPRDEAGDLAKLREAGVDLVWSPSVDEMYPDGAATLVVPEGAALGLEGEFRPQHFGGVATVCLKLFNQVAPDIAVFGEKDYQQLAVIRQLVRDFDLDLKIAPLPTVREKDGLALSSRNRYLTEAERKIAPLLYEVISDVATRAKATSIAKLRRDAESKLLAAGFAKVDYIAVRDADNLNTTFDSDLGRPGRVLAAVWLGKTRLIDNVGC
jgi:pantoate--beta-alanine ligase